MEKAVCIDWLSHKIVELQKANPGDDAKVMVALHKMFVSTMDTDADKMFWGQMTNAAGGTSEGVVKLLRDLDPLYQRLAKIMALPLPEFETQAKQFEAGIQKSQNPFASEFLAGDEGYEKARSKEFRIQAWLAMVHAAVEYRLHGEAGLKSVMDPLGKGPFAFQRFVFEGVDRGFELKSAYAGTDAPFVMIFVEKEGPAFQITGPDAGKAIDK